MALLTTVTLNTAVDTTYTVNDFKLDAVNRVAEVRMTPGGKGINVARVATILGGEVLATGFVGGSTGRFIAEELAAEGVKNDFISIQGTSRVCLAILDPERETQTELLEPGPEVSAAEWERMKEKVKALAAQSAMVVLSGSLPRGLAVTAYADLIAVIRQEGARPVLDTSGEALRAGLEATPYLVKPNQEEMEALLGRKIPDRAAVLAAAQELRGGIAIVVISLGAEGSLAVTAEGAWFAAPPPIDPVNTVGCGDSLVAGMTLALARGQGVEEALRLGTAAAAANALTPRAGYCRPEDVERFLPQVKIEAL